MENKIAVVLDSTTTLPVGYLSEMETRTAPAIIIWDGEELLDGIDIQPDEFYARLAEAKVMPSTSQATPIMFREHFEELAAKGFDILAVTISSKLSGMYTSAMQAKQALGDARIEVVDSLTGTMTVGLSLGRMFEALKGGANLQQCRQALEDALANTGVLLTVETLDFLHRGGRIGGAQRLVGTMLNFKPILEVIDGRIEPGERVRTRKKSLNRIVELAVEKIGDRRPVYLSVIHANAVEDAERVMEMIGEQLPLKARVVTSVAPTVGTHTGPGTIGIAYMAGYDYKAE